MRGITEAAVEITGGNIGRAGGAAGSAAQPGTVHGPVQGPARGPRLAPYRSLTRSTRKPEHCTDGELVTLALNGGRAAFSHLMRRHAPHLHAVIARRLRDPEDVRDAIQDTHLAVWRALQHYDAGRPFEAWITTIALNKCRDSARRRAAQLAMLSRLQWDGIGKSGGAAEERGVERWLIGRESVHRLGKALEMMPAQLRAALILTAVREHSQESVARRLGLTRKAVEMRVRRARQHLARALQTQA